MPAPSSLHNVCIHTYTYTYTQSNRTRVKNGDWQCGQWQSKPGEDQMYLKIPCYREKIVPSPRRMDSFSNLHTVLPSHPFFPALQSNSLRPEWFVLLYWKITNGHNAFRIPPFNASPVSWLSLPRTSHRISHPVPYRVSPWNASSSVSSKKLQFPHKG